MSQIMNVVCQRNIICVHIAYICSTSIQLGFGRLPLRHVAVGALLEETSTKFGARTALVSRHQEKQLTFTEVLTAADKLGAGLKSLDLAKKDRVGLWSSNCLEWYISYMACARAGLIMVALNPAYQPAELEYCINKVGLRILLCGDDESHYEIMEAVAPEIKESEPGKLKSARVPSLTSVVSIGDNARRGTFCFDEVLQLGGLEDMRRIKQMQKYISPDDSFAILFTSGTTGKPKAAILNHFGLINNALDSGRRAKIGDRPVIGYPGQLFHVMGSYMLLLALQFGGSLVLPSKAYSSMKWLEAIVQENCTVLSGSPTMYIDLLQTLNPKDDPLPVRTAFIGGSAASTALLNKAVNLLNLQNMTIVYGSTESCGPVFQSSPGEPKEKNFATVGSIFNHKEAKVIDAEGNIVPFGTPGELCIRASTNMLGYWGDDVATNNAIGPKGWFKTGDLFVLYEDGYGKVVGRKNDMLLRGGENIYPAEVEEVVNLHPDVLEAHVIGLPHERLGEEVCACVILKPGATMTVEDLKAFCRGKIAQRKIPSVLKVVKEFPKTPIGKVKKHELREAVFAS